MSCMNVPVICCLGVSRVSGVGLLISVGVVRVVCAGFGVSIVQVVSVAGFLACSVQSG